MAAPALVLNLVERFREQAETYTSSKYNETQARREFIDPFFKALGWDIDNTEGFSEVYKDVVHEDAIKIAGSHRAPDYSFRVGGTRKFFLEAKKPAVSIKTEDKVAYQLRRYGWSAKLALSVVTSFRELALYDCRVKPEKNDNPAAARVLYFTYEEYPNRWDEIASVLSKTAVYKGAFDRFSETSKLKKGTAEVDDAFLADIEAWRDLLARNIALRNPGLSQHHLNFAVQATIDRIIFLRICEDRGIEPYGQLSLVKQVGLYKNLFKLFQSADDRYNSGLFHFRVEKNRPEQPDLVTPHLKVDDITLSEVISHLYYPESPYEFSVLGADILGHVYEQFLGRVIRLTPGHRAVVEEKPEVKKAGGVYYTPTYIVDYIVENTIGAWLRGKNVGQAASLHVLDPACGSGSFLIAAYQYLLDWHLSQYVKSPDSFKQRLYRFKDNEWRLTSRERKRILLAHIFGVDVDAQAVEVTKLSLLLKVLERESADSLKKQLEMFHERALPDLGDNIKHGNSLISSDILADEQFDLLSMSKRDAINPFDWRVEFTDIMETGGFTIILGNPPYVNAWIMYESTPEIRNYLNASVEYRSADRHWDTYVLFIERSLKLLRPQGRLSFIVPFSYCIQKYAAASRKILLEEFTIESVADLRTVRVFKNVPVITIIPVIFNKKPGSQHQIKISRPGADASSHNPGQIGVSHSIGQRVFEESSEFMWRLDLNPVSLTTTRIIEKTSLKLGDISWVNYGAQMSSKRKGAFGKSYVLRETATTKTCKKTISGRNLYRYQVKWEGKYVEWSLASKMYGPRETWFFETPKLMIRDITGTHRLEMSADRAKTYCDHTVLCCLRACDVDRFRTFEDEAVQLSKRYSLELLLGLLASRLVSAYYYWNLTGEGVRIGGGFHTYPNTIRALPVFDVRRASPEQKQLLQEIETFAKQMLDIANRVKKEKEPGIATKLRREFLSVDRRVDTAVYKLYGLTQEQISTVEKATA
jgi:type I restriction-modification system DNA methylase subunit